MIYTGFRSPLTIALLIQSFVIVAGTFITTGMLKAYGYPDEEIMIWNPVSVFVRSWGWWAILIPPVWLGTSLWRGIDTSSFRPAIIASIGVVALFLFYTWTATTVGHYRYNF